MQAELYHLAHCELLGELTVFVAISAIILATASVGIGSSVHISQGHTATLTKLLFHTSTIFSDINKVNCLYPITKVVDFSDNSRIIGTSFAFLVLKYIFMSKFGGYSMDFD